jgi:hypothetical protein
MVLNFDSKFSYIKNSNWKKESTDIERLTRKGYNLEIEGYIFLKRRVNNTSINWSCKNKECKSNVSIRTDNQKIIHLLPHDQNVDHKLQPNGYSFLNSIGDNDSCHILDMYQSKLTDLVRMCKSILDTYLETDEMIKRFQANEHTQLHAEYDEDNLE